MVTLDMRFYILPTEQDKTVCINFDHVARIDISKTSVELYFVGVEAPMVMAKTVNTLSLIGKGMDISDSSKEQISRL